MRFEDKLRKITRFTKKFHKRLARKTAEGHVRELRKGFNVDGSRMTPYTAEYFYDKRAMKFATSGIGLSLGMGKGQDKKYASGQPNLSLSGDMLDDMKKVRQVRLDGFKYGITNATEGAKATYQSGLRPGLKPKYHRKITGNEGSKDVVHPSVKDKVIGSYMSAIVSNIKKLPKKEIL